MKEWCAASWMLIRRCGDVWVALALGICDGDGDERVCDGADGGYSSGWMGEIAVGIMDG